MKSLKVLVADDDEEYRQRAKNHIKNYLSNRREKSPLELELKEAETPEQASQLVNFFYPDLIILDVCFGNGKNTIWIDKFLKLYRKSKGKAKIICWSADKSNEWIAKKAGANEFLYKEESYHLYDAMIVQLETFGDYA